MNRYNWLENEILLCKQTILNNFYFMKKIDLWSKFFEILKILVNKVIFLTNKSIFFLK